MMWIIIIFISIVAVFFAVSATMKHWDGEHLVLQMNESEENIEPWNRKGR